MSLHERLGQRGRADMERNARKGIPMGLILLILVLLFLFGGGGYYGYRSGYYGGRGFGGLLGLILIIIIIYLLFGGGFHQRLMY